MPSSGRLDSMFRGLERVTRSHLEYAGLPLNLRQEVGPSCWRVQVPQRGIAADAEARTGGVDRRKRLQVGEVKHIPTKLQLVLFAPRHVQRLRQTKIHIHISGQAEVIPRASFSGIGISEALIDGFDVTATTTKELRRARTVGASADWTQRSDIGLHVPVGCPAGIVVGRQHR